MAAASISLCSRHTPPKWSSACSTRKAPPSWNASRCPSTRTRSGTATSKAWDPARCTAIACTARTHPKRATASIRTSCCSTRMPAGSWARSSGTTPASATRIGAEGDDLSFNELDSAPFMPKCLVVDQSFDWKQNGKPRVAWDRTIVYEAHVRGFTRQHPAVAESLRGTFAGLATPEVIDYVRALGVTTVELMPVQSFVNDSHLLERGPDQLLGLQHHRLLRRRSALLRQPDEWRARVQGDGGALPRRGPRGHPRRGLQPHRRGQRARSDAVVQGHRQRVLLPARARQSATTSTTPAPATRSIFAPARDPDGHGFACATGCWRWTSTDSASTSAPSWRASPMASTIAAASSRCARRIRC